MSPYISLWWDVTVCGKVTLVILHGMGGVISPGGMISPELSPFRMLFSSLSLSLLHVVTLNPKP